MSRIPKPDTGIMVVIVPFVILLLVLIALEPARAASLADTVRVTCATIPS